MWAWRTDRSLDEVNLAYGELEAAGMLGATEVDGHTTVYFPRPVDLRLPGRWEPVADRDWNLLWKEGLEPVTVGAITVAPPWLAAPDALVIEPGQAFGTGHHETTTACLAALQELELSGRSVLDVGTGSGVLALAAVRLGAGRVVAVDTDPLAVDAARANADRNGIDLDVRAGSLEATDECFDVVVANLDTATLAGMAAGLAERLSPGGTLIASGVSVERQAEAASALRAAGLAPTVRPGQEWALLVSV